MKNKKAIYIMCVIISVALIVLAITYAFWQITKVQQGVNEITAACLDITLEDAESGNTGVTLQDQYPVSDTEGAKLKPYKFTVTNNCDTRLLYQIALESTGSSTDALKSSSLKVMLDDKTSLLNANKVVTPTIDGAYTSHKLGTGILAAKGVEGNSVTHEIRLWIDESAPVSENNKTYTGKITVTIGQGITGGESLATLIMSDAEANNYLYSTTPAFDSITTEGEYGLYKTVDDDGDTYYFRGDVDNNYVEFGPDEYRSAYSPSNVSLEALESKFGTDLAPTYKLLFESLVASTEEYCINVAALMGFEGVWAECAEKKDLTSVYNSNTGKEEEINILGFLSNENCIMGMQALGASVDSCVEKEVIVGMQPSMYWRVIRINGDDSIRLIYDGPNAVANEINNALSSIENVQFNTSAADAKYVGYIYEEDGEQKDSNIKNVLETWYTNNLEKEYGKHIADSIFCNDREVTSTNGNTQYYGAYDRLDTNKSPKLTCTRDEDKLTVLNSKLKKPVGLITADEVAMAGGLAYNSNETFYLNSGVWYWTMSPQNFDGSNANVWPVNYDGNLFTVTVTAVGGLRPVINIKSDTLFTGSGTVNDPYRLAE